ncbi:MAG: 2-oxoacid:acceptor oxidoreductase family protein [Acetomicrobium sp.]|uniref:2-oxoacid:acceptor oxidoreductase family protein n=1 Tax=Acetomicrobium sp. TaxID=1872099 RepID=UPI002B2566F4|nr:2-oxoacid:acceptor oxidoreductase family protein [Acetomicrobium sp.]HPT65061.1 2-oxoacid:acceptor oxidoreductase family protein [Acetomicrobium sp.]HXK99492.1 2-oxoacid:acceptor oxidoreductase family protein [Acetomicrobium sp.]
MGDQRYEIRIAGSGGQGVILAAVIVGEALALYEEGLNVVQTQAYGPEARGGASKAEVVVSRSRIDYPKVTSPNLQVILTQKACDKYVHDALPGSVVIVDDFFVTEPPKVDAKVYSLPIVKTAREEVGREIVTNMVALGAVARVLESWELAKPESIRKAILDRVPKGTEELNLKAFELGYGLMKEKL